ncbi:exosortase family protein XrtM [Methylomonas methanica]|uniref:Exosortase EpsH-related protein n=1 Tax=Methylomonas methanica (strain DSM 25384 / MC09) TaxID=857087 RepID=G0A553_METMM|nr:exosortase family protein XrtM [Methylomonas methanica]AEG00383.1 Exosortase EpsH-related protein [Methylomonas methanica MC09]
MISPDTVRPPEPRHYEEITVLQTLKLFSEGYRHYSRHTWLQFLLFVGCYVLFDYAYFKIPVDLFANVIYYHGVVAVCADVVNWLSPLEQVLAKQNHLLSATADLEIVRGCDGAGVLFLVASAVLVFPSRLKRKLVGLILGIGLIYFLNLLRICVLYFVIAYHPGWFQLIHTYVAPTLMVVMGCLYFAWWAFGSAHPIHEPA